MTARPSSRAGIEVEVLLGVGRDLPGRERQHRHVREQREQRVARRDRPRHADGCGSIADGRLADGHGRRRRSASVASTSSVPRAVAPHVSCRACSSARRAQSGPAARRRRARVRARPRSSEGPSTRSPVSSSSTASCVSGDAGRDRRRAARRRLGDRHAPAFVGGRARDHPRAAVQRRAARRRRRQPGSVIQSSAPSSSRSDSESLAFVALADDDRAERRVAGATRGQRLDEHREPLHRNETADRDARAERRTSLPPGEKRASTPGGTTCTRAAVKPRRSHELPLRRLRERHDRRAPVERRRDPELDRAAEPGERAAAASSPTSCRARGAAT